MERKLVNKSETLIVPEPLRQGDTIGIVAPSSQLDLPVEIKHQAYHFLQNKGFIIKEARDANLVYGHTAGSAKERADQIHQLVRDPKVKTIMSFWGGYNSNQLLDHLDFDMIKMNPKIFIGYSDFTTVNLAITSFSGLITYTGPSIISFTEPKQFDYTWESFENSCINRREVGYVPSAIYTDDLGYIEDPGRQRVLKENTGPVIFRGGQSNGLSMSANIMSLASLTGTHFLPNLKDRILFLEEAEYANTGMVDRALTQLKQAGVFSELSGVVLGRFMSKSGFCDEDKLEDLIADVFGDFSYPVMYNIDFGHTDPMITVPNGLVCELDCTNKSFKFKYGK